MSMETGEAGHCVAGSYSTLYINTYIYIVSCMWPHINFYTHVYCTVCICI